jgi:pimeloyl-ACP methyl ester carboxylesterase
LIPGFASDELRRAKVELWNRVRAKVLAARSRAVLGVDVRSQLKDLTAPLMYLGFKSDDVVPRRCLEEVVSIAPQTHVAEVEGGHLGLFTHPRPSAKFIADFLGNCTLESSPNRNATA